MGRPQREGEGAAARSGRWLVLDVVSQVQAHHLSQRILFMRRWFPPLVVLSCSTLAPAQGMAPAPAAAPPAAPTGFLAPAHTPVGAGAPWVGQPGQQAPPPPPRSPNARVLPPTAEPGLWAADEPRAAKRSDPAAPDVDELFRPQPSPGTPELASCRERVRRASRDSGLEDVRRSLPGVNRECLTARLLLQCHYRESLEFREALEKTPRTAEVTARLARYSEESSQVVRWEERVCHGFLTLPLIEELRASIHAHLERQFRRPETRR